MSTGPYQPPSGSNEKAPPDTSTGDALIYVLSALVALNAVCAIGLTLLGLVAGQPQMFGGGIVSFGFYVAIFIGLLKRQEWARTTLIWMCYVGLVVAAIQIPSAGVVAIGMMILPAITVLFAHMPAVRNLTRDNSLAKPYIYVDESESS